MYHFYLKPIGGRSLPQKGLGRGRSKEKKKKNSMTVTEASHFSSPLQGWGCGLLQRVSGTCPERSRKEEEKKHSAALRAVLERNLHW